MAQVMITIDFRLRCICSTQFSQHDPLYVDWKICSKGWVSQQDALTPTLDVDNQVQIDRKWHVLQIKVCFSLTIGVDNHF